MLKQEKILALIGAILSSSLAYSSVAAASLNTPTSKMDIDMANTLADMIERGVVSIDPKTGKLLVNESVLNILREYSVINETELPIVEVGTGSTGHQCAGGRP